MKRESIKSIHFIKAICAIGIIVYHFSCYKKDTSIQPLYTFANGSWGSVFVTAFFIVSGMLLYYNYEEGINLKKYYIKRWKSIYPMFYIAYLSFFIGKLFYYGTPFYKDKKWSYIFTILGFDGYLYSNTTTYYILGEWFLGAIIILYILFPVIRMAIVALAFCVMLGNVKVNILQNSGNHIMGIMVFIVLFVIGDIIMNKSVINKIFTELSKISYAIFLVQNTAIAKVTGVWNPSETYKVVILLFATIGLIICEAKMLTIITNEVVVNVGKLKEAKSKE